MVRPIIRGNLMTFFAVCFCTIGTTLGKYEYHNLHLTHIESHRHRYRRHRLLHLTTFPT